MKDIKVPAKLRVEISNIPEDMIFSPIEATPDIPVFSPPRECSYLRRYDELLRDLYTDGIHYNRQCLLKGLSFELQAETKGSFEECYNLLVSVANSMILNELEVVYWSLLLKNRNPLSPQCKNFAYFTAYLSKYSLNSDMAPFEAFISTIIPNFRMNFYNWQVMSDLTLDISTKDLNSRYKYLLMVSEKITKDYESMVGNLMQIPRRKISIVSESHISEDSFEELNSHIGLEGFELDLLEEAKNSPIDKH